MTQRILENRGTGDRMIVHTTPADSDGTLFLFEYVTRAVTPPPEDHLHPDQEERIHVLAGMLRCRVDGHERVLHAGETLVIPPGVLHALWNADPVESRAIGEFRPALDTMALFEAYFAAA